MERTRQAEMKRQFEMIAKAAFVNNIKVKIPLEKVFNVRKSIFSGIKKT
jgi:hypothetical protein